MIESPQSTFYILILLLTTFTNIITANVFSKVPVSPCPQSKILCLSMLTCQAITLSCFKFESSIYLLGQIVLGLILPWVIAVWSLKGEGEFVIEITIRYRHKKHFRSDRSDLRR